MTITVNIDNSLQRLTFVGLILLLCAGGLWLIYARFVVDVLTTKKSAASLETVAAAVSRFPDSARLQARFADALLSQSAQEPELIAQAEAAAEQSVNLSPFNARFRLLLAATKSLSGHLDTQEADLRAALSLAPHNTQIHWRLANVLLRAGKLDASLAEFRVAVTADPKLLPVSLDLLWQLANGELATLKQATGEAPKNRLMLAQFLLQKSRIDDAVSVFNQIEKTERLAAPETASFVNTLLGAGKPEVAYQVWRGLFEAREGQQALLWNGSLEEASPSHLHQFDWQLKGSEYAQLAIDSNVAHSGTKSLRLDFLGRDTTRLTNEIKQLAVVRPGGHYRLSGFVKTANLETPEGPRLVVATADGVPPIATSMPIKAGANDWQEYAVDFTAPLKSTALIVAVQRLPKTSYDDPTQGTIWFDDFTLTELR